MMLDYLAEVTMSSLKSEMCPGRIRAISPLMQSLAGLRRKNTKSLNAGGVNASCALRSRFRGDGYKAS